MSTLKFVDGSTVEGEATLVSVTEDLHVTLFDTSYEEVTRLFEAGNFDPLEVIDEKGEILTYSGRSKVSSIAVLFAEERDLWEGCRIVVILPKE